ncbi:hypothetical protein [Actinosynnema mirum]|uniref:hypothetical protein n=1 Tax=Actinosynnema mirum TaxID=40567 RepID=UPI00019AC46B|nr:hypothetical protein [Actinosynnema mirum]
MSEATDPVFWGRHLRDAVRFADALGTLLTGGDALLELGPGRTLGGLARRHPAFVPHRPVVRSLPHAADGFGGEVEFLRATGALRAAGVDVDWSAVHHDRARRKVPLPGYPYQRARYRLDEPLPGERGVSGEPGERGECGASGGPGWLANLRGVAGAGGAMAR